MIYFDNAATTFPKPQCVSAELLRCIRSYCGNPGRSDHKLSLEAARKIFECREKIADLFGYPDPEDVTFTHNATYAINIAIKSRVRKGDHVLISDIEHNSVLRPVHKLKTDGIINYDIYKSGGSEDDVIRSIIAHLRPNTSLVIANHMSNICTRKLPIRKIADICRHHKIKLICDVSQSAGTIDCRLDTPGISAICAPAHKGLYGLQGVGFVINCDKVTGDTVVEGGGGINSLDPSMPALLPDRYEPGTQNTPGIAALCASLEWVKSISPEEILEKENALRLYTVERLRNVPGITVYGDDRDIGGIVLFNRDGCPASDVGARLADQDICVRSGYHCSPLAHKALATRRDGAVRISFSYFNTKSEVDRMLIALKNINI